MKKFSQSDYKFTHVHMKFELHFSRKEKKELLDYGNMITVANIQMVVKIKKIFLSPTCVNKVAY